jgi:hypothetical protein
MLPNQFTTPHCTLQPTCECATTATEFTALPHVLLFTTETFTPPSNNLYLTYYASVIGVSVNEYQPNSIQGSLQVEPLGSGKDQNGICTLGGLDNFWRSATFLEFSMNSNLSVSQASPIRKCIFDGDLILCGTIFQCCNDSAEYTSGGYMSHCTVKGTMNFCSQQQFLAKDCVFSKDHSIEGGAWNITFLNCTQPNQSIKYGEKCAYTVIRDPVTYPSNPSPRLIYDDRIWKIRFYQENGSIDREIQYCADPGKIAPSQDKILEGTAGTNLNDFFIANSNVDMIVLPAGYYFITQSIEIKAHLIGIGIPVLRLLNGATLTFSGNKQIVSSVVIDNFNTTKDNIDNLITIHSPSSFYHDFILRQGGGTQTDPYTGNDAILVSDMATGTYIDNWWIWRGDHGNSGTYTVSQGFGKNGVDISADNVIAIGLAVEHWNEKNTIWNGNNGKLVFYQCEFLYTLTQSIDNYGGLNLFGNKFEGYSIGVYSFFLNKNINALCAVYISESAQNIKLSVVFTKFLNGNGGIDHVICQQNGTTSGNRVDVANGGPEFIYEYPIKEYYTRIYRRPVTMNQIQYQ